MKKRESKSLLDVHTCISGRAVICLNARDGSQSSLRLPLARVQELLRKLPPVRDELVSLQQYALRKR